MSLKRKILNPKQYREKVLEIESIQLKDVIDEITNVYFESENILKKNGGWPGYNVFYNPREDFIFLPKISISYVPKDELDKESILETSQSDLYSGDEIDDIEFRKERLKEEILNTEEYVLKDYRRSLISGFEQKKRDQKEILSGKEEFLAFLKNEFVDPLNRKLKGKNLPLLNVTHIDYEPLEDDCLEMLHFNVESWSTYKLSLYSNGGFNHGHSDLSKTWEAESYIYQIIENVEDWVDGMKEEQLKDLLDKAPVFKIRN